MPRKVDATTVEEERARLVAVASALLTREGPEAVTNRRVATEAGLTTMALYSRLGGKSGLIDGLIAEGFERLAEAQAAVPADGEVMAELEALCARFREVALAHPQHYRLMFGRHPDWEPGPVVRQAGRRTLDRLGAAVGRGVATGAVRGEPFALTWQLFSLCHGLVSMELSTIGVPPELPPAAVYTRAVRRFLDPSEPGPQA
jgi:AcrR family transcriptional regulator